MASDGTRRIESGKCCCRSTRGRDFVEWRKFDANLTFNVESQGNWSKALSSTSRTSLKLKSSVSKEDKPFKPDLGKVRTKL